MFNKANNCLADIIKNKVKAPLAQPRRLKKAKEDISSSAESEDHLLFKGKKQCLATDGPSEWKYRGRSSSEVTSNEPLSAPAGLAAQQREGFQKFFKAVVSPTHIRVTAGGRIVPNTRAVASPSTKWDKINRDHDTHGPIDTTKNGKVEVENGVKSNILDPARGQVSQPPVFFQHPGMHFPFGILPNGVSPAYGFPQHPPFAPNSVQSAPFDAKPEPQKTTSAAHNDDEPGTKKSQSGTVKVSPPGQFDHSKPYTFNGNWFYPTMGPGPGPMPGQTPSFIPAPYFSHADQAAFAAARMASMGHLPPPVPMFGPPGPIPNPHGVAPAASRPQAAQQPSFPVKPVAAPPISSIRPSEITKQQLDQLRTAAKYFEDQLLYNKHQIDEKTTEAQVMNLKAKVQHFEYNLRMQLAFEAKYYPKQTQSTERTTAAPAQEAAVHRDTPSRPLSMKDNHSDNLSQDDSNMSIRSGTQASSIRHKQLSNRPRPRSKGFKKRDIEGINAFKSDSHPSAALEALEAHIKQSLQLEHDKRQNPASDVAVASSFHTGTNLPVPSVSGDGQNEAQSWLTGEQNYQRPSAIAYPQNPRGSWGPMQTTNTYLAGDSASIGIRSSTGAFGMNLHSAPYLIGRLPQGVTASGARATDYIYARELTDEEIRARHVYWGQVSIKGTGLPKFDGKDFYPPSPVKTDEKSGPRPRIPSGRPDVDYGFESSTDNDPFRSSRDGGASIRSQESTQRLSRAIPIVNPDSVGHGGTSKTPNADSARAIKMGRDLARAFEELKKNSPATESTDGRKSAMPSRRAIERSR